MTHPTDEELEEQFSDEIEVALDPMGAWKLITYLRAQLAEARAERDVWEIDAKRNHQAAEIEFARADRAEAALAEIKQTLGAPDEWHPVYAVKALKQSHDQAEAKAIRKAADEMEDERAKQAILALIPKEGA